MIFSACYLNNIFSLQAGLSQENTA